MEDDQPTHMQQDNTDASDIASEDSDDAPDDCMEVPRPRVNSGYYEVVPRYLGETRFYGLKGPALQARHENNVLFQANDPYFGARRYGMFPSWKHARRAVLETIPDPFRSANPRHSYEMLMVDRPQKPFGDIDGKIEEGLAHLPPDIVMRFFTDHIVRIFRERYGETLQRTDVKWTYSSNPKKLSLHFVVTTHPTQLVFRTHLYSDPGGAKDLADRLQEVSSQLRDYLPNPQDFPNAKWEKLVDLRVYTPDREFRLPGCFKYDRPPESHLKPVLEDCTPVLGLGVFPSDYLISDIDTGNVKEISVPVEAPECAVGHQGRRRDVDAIWDVGVTEELPGDGCVVEMMKSALDDYTMRSCTHVPSDHHLHNLRFILEHVGQHSDIERWMRVGLALHRSTRGSSAGLELFREWSALAEVNYPKGDGCAPLWRSAGRSSANRKVTIRTLIYFANQDRMKAGKDPVDFTEDITEVFRLPEGSKCLCGKLLTSAPTAKVVRDIALDIHAICESCDGAKSHVIRSGVPFPEKWRDVAQTIDTRYLGCTPDEACYDAGGEFISPAPLLNSIMNKLRKAKRVRTVLIRSPMASGKSTLLDLFLKLLDHFAACERILVISYRRSLSMEMLNKLKEHGFVCYLDFKDKSVLRDREKYPRVIIQLDSVHFVGGPAGGGAPAGYDPLWDFSALDGGRWGLVVADESESLLRHMSSETIRVMECLRVLRYAVMSCERLLAMDAFLADCSYEYYKALRGPLVLVNNLHRSEGRRFEVTRSRNSRDVSTWVSSIVTALIEGQNVVVASMTSGMLDHIESAVKAADIPDFDYATEARKYTAREGAKEELRCVNSAWAELRLLMYSPTIESGVDFSAENFDSQFVFVVDSTTSPLGLAQMLYRVRKLRNHRVSILAEHNVKVSGVSKYRPVRLEDAYRFQVWSNVAPYEMYGSVPFMNNGLSGSTDVTGSCERMSDEPVRSSFNRSRPDELLRVRAWHQMERENMRRRFMYEFQRLMTDAGHTVVSVDPETGETENMFEALTRMQGRAAAEAALSPKELKLQRWLKAAAEMPLTVGTEEFAAQEALIQSNKPHDPLVHFAVDVARYKFFWSIDRVTEEFLEKFGTHPEGHTQTSRMGQLLYPRLARKADAEAKESNTDERPGVVSECVSSVLSALGVKHPFDGATAIDMGAAWDRLVEESKWFQTNDAFRRMARLIGSQSKKCPEMGKRFSQLKGSGDNSSAAAVRACFNIVLGAVGMKLVTKYYGNRKKGKKAKQEFRLSGDATADMLLKVRFHLRRPPASLGECRWAEADALVHKKEYGVFDAVVDELPSFAFEGL